MERESTEQLPGFPLHRVRLRHLPTEGSLDGRVYSYVIDYTSDWPRGPSLDEVAFCVEANRSVVNKAIGRLLHSGLLRRDGSARRSLRPVLAVLLLLTGALAPTRAHAMYAGRCADYFVTAYLRHSPPMNPLTADGTPIWTAEPIVAASLELPFDAVVDIGGWGHFRVADRFGDPTLSNRLDVAVWTVEEAAGWTGWYEVCRVR